MRSLGEVEVAVDAQNSLGEGPVWDDRSGLFRWVDIVKSEVHTLDPADGAVSTVVYPEPVGAFALREGGGLVGAVGTGFAYLGDDGSLDWIAKVDAPEGGRMNDGKADPAGRFWAGTTGLDVEQPEGTLFRLGADGAVTPTLDKLAIANGLDWSPDRTRMYYIDTPTYRVDVLDYDLDSGAIENRRPLVEIPHEHGWPDGMTVDAEGFLWVAFWGGSAVRRYSPDGEPAGMVELPTPNVTSCAFGGADLGDLYITTAADEGGAKHAGSLFVCRPGAAGRAPNRYAG